MSRNIDQMLLSDEIVRKSVLARHPEYITQLKAGQRSYLYWLYRRELRDGNWPACLAILRRTRNRREWRVLARLLGLFLREAKPAIKNVFVPSRTHGQFYMPSKGSECLAMTDRAPGDTKIKSVPAESK